jgi:WD40 repeat protein
MDPLNPGDPAQVGAYRLLGRLGAGGMGQVYLGVSPGSRKVAVKLLHKDLVADAEFRARFAREVAVARTVNGFYTAPVVDADPDASPPWMVTAYVSGPSLAAAVRERGPLPEAEARELGAALAEGLASIHASGLIHRDLKPGNIILADDGPRIIDFGIARVVGATTMTEKGTVVGTYSFMSPEQVMGKPLEAASDVFSLGAVLAYTATGRGPFDAETIPTITYRLLTEPPDLAGLADGPLRALIIDCLHKDPAQRPSLRDILARLSGLDLPASAPATPSYVPTVRAAQAAATVPSAPASPAPGSMAPPGPAGGQGQAPPGMSSAAGAAPAPTAWLIRPPDGVPLWDVAFSPDGRLVAASSVASGTWRVHLWDTATRELAGPPLWDHGDTAPRLGFSADGRLLALTDERGTGLRLLPAGQPVLPASQGLPGKREPGWRRAVFSSGEVLATVSPAASTQVHFWSSATLQRLGPPARASFLEDGSAVKFSPDGHVFLAGTDLDIFLGDLRAPAFALHKVRGYLGASRTCCFSADSRLLAVLHATSGEAHLLDTATHKAVARLRPDRGTVFTLLRCSPAGSQFATVSSTASRSAIDLWATPAGPPTRLPWPGHLATGLSFSGDGQFLVVTASIPGRRSRQVAQVWRTDAPGPVPALDLPGPALAMFSPDSRFYAASCADMSVLVWEAQVMGVPRVLGSGGSGYPARRRGMAFSPDSRLLATTDPDGLRLWPL